ncbi:rod shape-determining protein MreD [Pseudomonas sp. gcc21]|uniref:rod shape-determining protein MreD n=1 Tax=Pseudomonas sp. gcc21 TaxID=2726989 RepID=UPI0035578C04
MRHSLVIGFTVLLALLLGVMPMPEPFDFGRPMWLAMTVAFWVMLLPHRVGLVMAWFAGIASDVLYGELFGQHALVMTLVATMVLLLYQRIRRFPLWQQSLVMLPVFGVAQLLLLWLNSLAGSRPPILLLLLPALVSALLWPWACAFLNVFRRRFHVV